MLRVTHELQAMKDKIKREQREDQSEQDPALPGLQRHRVCVYVEGKRGQWGLEAACHWGKGGWASSGLELHVGSKPLRFSSPL